MKRILFIAVAFSFTAWLFSSCTPKSSTTTAPATALMLVHASANTPALDFFVSNGYTLQPIATSQGYLQTSGYLSATSGVYAMFIDTASQTDNNFLLAQYVPLNGGGGNSLFIIDSSASVTRGLIVTDDLTKANADSSGIRFFHFAPGAPKVDVYISSSTTPDFSNRDFFYQQTNETNLASTKFSRVLKGTYTVSIRTAGTSTELYSFTANFESTKLYTLFLSGFTGGTDGKALTAKLITNQ